MRRPSLVLATLAWLLATVAVAASAATDLRIQLNPILAALAAEDPAKAAAVLDALTRIIEGPPPPPPAAERPATRSIEDPYERGLIEGNPLFEEAWRIDPKAALEQLREIVASGGGS